MRRDLHPHLVVVALAVGVVDDEHVVDRGALVAGLFGVEEARLYVFVVDADDAVGGRAVDGEIVDPVMMLADLVFHLGAGVGAGAIGGHVARDGRARGTQHLIAVALGQNDRVVEADGHGLETDEARGRGRLRERRAPRQRPANQARRDRGEAADQKAPTRHARLHDLVEIAVVRRVALRLVAVLIPHRLPMVGIVALEILHVTSPLEQDAIRRRG